MDGGDMNMAMRSVIEAIHSAPTQTVIHIAGGASQVTGWLTSVPGASNTVLEVVVPYSSMSMIQLLGKIPTQFASKQTAQDMALVAYNRALKLSRPGSPVTGVGFTGSLASSQPKRGDHRFHLATRTSDALFLSSVTLSKGLRTRDEEEFVSSQVLLKAIAKSCKIPALFDSGLGEGDVTSESETIFSEDEELDQLLSGQICLKVYPFSSGGAFNSDRKIILPGSFNPLHDGHIKLLEAATRICGDGYPCFEISVVNADKPPLTIPKIKERVLQFRRAGRSVIISNQPFFYKKAELLPGSVFVIGVDTAVRLVDPKYYDGNYKRMIEILLGCKNTGCSFLVGGRCIDGIFKVLEDIEIPEMLKEMFIPIPAEKFRVDISSTELRRRLGL